MTKEEIGNFLDKELLPQAKQEIENWIRPKKKQGGYFVCTRQTLCMVDFLGVVYWGHPKAKYEKGKNLAREEKALKFITTFFKPKLTYGNDKSKILYNMYRHGLVHLYQPKFLKLSNGSILKWFFYRGNRQMKSMSVNTNDGKKSFKNVEHLKIIWVEPGRGYLPICVDALYSDFVEAVLGYKKRLAGSATLQRKWRIAVNAILKPKLIDQIDISKL